VTIDINELGIQRAQDVELSPLLRVNISDMDLKGNLIKVVKILKRKMLKGVPLCSFSVCLQENIFMGEVPCSDYIHQI